MFSSIQCFEYLFSGQESEINEIQNIINQFPNPEDINDNPITAPSKRILKIFPGYDKPLYGSLSCLEIGIENFLQKCLHFNNWVERLKLLKS